MFEVKNPEIQESLKKIGEYINGFLPKGWGFTLLIFDYGKVKHGGMFYISRANRQDMIEAMKEFIRKQEAN